MEKDPDFIIERIDGTNIIYNKIRGSISIETSNMLFAKNDEIVKTLDDPHDVRMLVDATESGKTDSKARKQFNQVLKDDNVKKMAILGNKPFLRAMLAFHRIVTGVDKIRNFSSREDAIEWLKL